MALDFPNSPSLNETFTSGDRTWIYDGAKWVLDTGETVIGLDNLSDVDTTGVTSGDFLKYDGSGWVPDAIPTINNLDDIGDVTITSAASGDFLTYNGTAWVNDAAPTYVQFDTSVGSPASVEGKLQWDSDFGTLSFGLEGNNSVQQVGMNQFAYCYNAEATTLNKGEAVYIFGGQGSQVSVKRASNVGDPTSSKTLGVVSESIASGGSGYVCTYGVLQGIDTSGYSEGAILYLGETAGTLTDTEPATPLHMVFVAVVIKADVGGELWIRPQNGYEISELHDVSISSPESGDVVTYDGTSWVNQQPMPSGSITQFAGSSAPSGWLTCDGTAVSRTTYAALFSVIGTTYGAGDGSTTFALPNLQGKVPVGYDSSQTEFDSLGETGGAKTHTLTTSEMPSHTHTQDAHGHTGTALTAGEHTHTTNAAYNTSGMGPAGAYAFYHYVRTENSSSAGSHSHTLSINNTTATNQNTGGGQAHNNLQPYIVLNYIIKT